MKKSNSETSVVNLKTQRFDVYIGRGPNGYIPYPPNKGCYGNPYSIYAYGLEECLRLYEIYFYSRIKKDKIFLDAILQLKGKTLGCYCKPDKCHGDIIARYLNEN